MPSHTVNNHIRENGNKMKTYLLLVLLVLFDATLEFFLHLRNSGQIRLCSFQALSLLELSGLSCGDL